MSDTSILEKLTPLFRRVFFDKDLVASPEMTAGEVRGWDSLGHVRLLVEIERAFAVRFSPTEISGLESVGQLADLIEKKTRPVTS
jgi:acyl carrier protein